MTLRDTIAVLERMARLQPSVRMIVRNDVYRLNTYPDARYGVFAWTQQQHRVAGDLAYFSFALFYIDRLTEDGSNEVEVQSTGIATLTNILRRLEDYGIEPGAEFTFQTFNQRFLDECAGVWCTVTMSVPVDDTCAEAWPDFNDDYNDDFLII
jgi:hypothetical protein